MLLSILIANLRLSTKHRASLLNLASKYTIFRGVRHHVLARMLELQSGYAVSTTRVRGFQSGVFVRGGDLNNWGGCAHWLQ